MRHILRLDPYPWQVEAIKALSLGKLTLGGKSVALVAPNGSGKTSNCIAPAILYFLTCFPRGQVPVTSSSWMQVEKQLFPALRRYMDNPFFDGWTFNKTEIRTPEGGFAVGFSTDNAGRAEGWHPKISPDVDPVFYVLDEAKTIPDSIFMGGAANAYAAAAFLNTDSLTTTGTATVTKTVPYQMARIGIPAGSHTTIQAPFEGPSSQWNYSSWAGFSFVWRATAAAKVTMGIGRGAKTIRTDLTTDSYTIIPGNDLAFNSGEILDITFDNVRDTARNGYTVRVREIYALNSTDGWQVKTTTSFIPATQNEPIPWTVCKIIYQQQAVAHSSVYENLGGLWLMVTGAQTNNLYKIATCRGVSNFETGVGISRWVTDVINTTSGTASVYAGPGEYAYYQPGNVNPLFYGLDAIGTNAVESEATAAFEDINVPIE